MYLSASSGYAQDDTTTGSEESLAETAPCPIVGQPKCERGEEVDQAGSASRKILESIFYYFGAHSMRLKHILPTSICA